MSTKSCEKCGSLLTSELKAQPIFRDKALPPIEIWPDCQTCVDLREAKVKKATDENNRDRWTRHSRIPVECRGLSLDPDIWPGLVIDRDNRAAINALREWVAGSGGLFLHGKSGSGKTLLAMAAAMDALRTPQEVLFLSEREITQLVRTSARKHGSDSEGAAIVERACSVPVLVIDDIVRHKLDAGTGFLFDRYFDIFDARCPAFGPKLKTLITSQLDPLALSKVFNDQALYRRMLRLLDAPSKLLGGDRSESDLNLEKWGIG